MKMRELEGMLLNEAWDGGDTALGPHGSKPLTDPDDGAVEQALLDRLAEVDIPKQELSNREQHVADMIVDTGFAEWIGPKGDVLSITSEGEAHVLGIHEHAGDRFQYTDADVAHLAHEHGAYDPDDAEVERALLDMLIDGDQYKDQLSNKERHVADMLVNTGHAEWVDEMGNADPKGFLLALTPGGVTYAWSRQPKTDDPNYWGVGDDDREVDAAKPGLNKESAAKPKHKGKSSPAEKKAAEKTLKSLGKKAKTFKGKAKQMDWADDPDAAVGALYAKAGRDPKKEVASNDAVWDMSGLTEVTSTTNAPSQRSVKSNARLFAAAIRNDLEAGELRDTLRMALQDYAADAELSWDPAADYDPEERWEDALKLLADMFDSSSLKQLSIQLAEAAAAYAVKVFYSRKSAIRQEKSRPTRTHLRRR